MQTFLERLESNNLDPEIDKVFVENLFDKLEEYYEKSPWEPFEDMLVIANIVVMDDTFYFNDEPVNVC
jgi:hypothetical protein